MTSAYSDSDSDKNLPSDASGDDELPTYVLTSTYKIPKLDRKPSQSSPMKEKVLPLISKESHTLPSRFDYSHRSVLKDHSKILAASVASGSSECSPLKLAEHEKSLNQQTKLTRKVEKLTANIKNKAEKKSKMERYKTGGGIRGLSKKDFEEPFQSTSSDGDVDEGSDLPPISKQQSTIQDQFPLPLSPPGLPVLVHPPVFITELYPPGLWDVDNEREGPFNNLEGNIMLQENNDVLGNLICSHWFLMCYRVKPCPITIWQWLFQIMCLSCDHNTAQKSFYTLSTLAKWTVPRNDPSVKVYMPSLHDVLEVLVRLGANRDLLEEKDNKYPIEESDDVFQSLPTPKVNLSFFFRYIPLAVDSNSSAISHDDIHQFILLFATISLDTGLTDDPYIQQYLSLSLSALIRAIPEDVWSTSLSILSNQLTNITSHHHNLVYLSRIITATSSRLMTLQRMVCRQAISKVVFNGDKEILELSNWKFAWKVVKHYFDQPAVNFEYYSLYSVMCMLNQLIHLSLIEWPSREKKRDFRSMLGILASAKIKDHPEKTERAPVKDLILSMALDMAVQRSKESTQMNLFAAFGT